MALIKNTAGQKIGAEMVSATDGSAFTGSVTVSVTIDAGTQATGSVGSGACAHEGNGYHTYAPAQAETNGQLVAFTFTGTGAVPATVQCFTVGYDETAAVVPANVVQVSGDARGAVIVSGTAAAIANGSITLASGQGTTLAGVESLLVVLTGGTNAIGKSRYIAHDTGDVFTVDPAWNAGETLPSGTITYVVVPAPPSPTSTVPKVDIDKVAGTTVDTAQAQLGVNVVSLAAAIAAEIRTALGMAAADMDTQLGAIDTVVDAILDDTGTSGVLVNSATPVNADVKKVNAVTLQGAGTSGDPWRPV